MLTQAKTILSALTRAGFDDARVTITETDVNELNIAHNHVSLMRTTQGQSLAVMAIQDCRRVTASVSSLDDSVIEQVIADLKRDVTTSPQDEAYAVAPNQMGSFEKGPQSVDREAIASSAKSLLEARAEQYPTFQIEECSIKHTLERTTLVTTLDTELTSSVGKHEVVIMGSSKDDHGSSSFTYTYGVLDALPERLTDVLDIDQMMANSVQETQTEMAGDKFTGDVVLTPMAVMDLIGWLTGQLGDGALISQTSVYQNAVGEVISAPSLSIRNHPQGAGQAPFNSEGFIIDPVTLIDSGRLICQLPSYYGSRKLGIAHTPVTDGCSIDAGDVSRADMQRSVQRGALVGRLSMGSPAPNGDFSGVIKNSFLLENGERTKALSETMITGNVAQMLKDIEAISSEVSDFGGYRLPWLKIGGLRFS
ncbi:metallopeptidase TldD-related protein [Marinimicrobium sp. ABcell2]|uniref:metallopeptidase TldD-related protein n=1 Tax=Marinimicrobium sp. ABcell2 TaxID=3069751 RepID=UPI0027B7F3F8|nr:metallopeptidase TldD-related protein [Marinimicrobium sp. ABcell2]MDQ2077116.1 metallopeptidase TldD-related protein [Marinimicrobium sp. ABcell2]